MPQKGHMFYWVHLFFCGMCMGAADIVPGVSGGTIAFILGIYEDFLLSIKSLNTHTLVLFLQLKYKKFFTLVRWKYLLSISMGIAASLLIFAGLIDWLLNDITSRTYLYAAFFGLILASVIFCAKQLSSWSHKEMACLIVAAIIAFGLTEFGNKLFQRHKALFDVPIENISLPDNAPVAVNVEHKTLLGVTADQMAAMVSKQLIKPTDVVFDQTLKQYRQVQHIEQYRTQNGLDIWLIICGMLAVSAMLLPGISGSYILHLLGVYGLVISALADLGEGLKTLTMQKEALWILTNVAVGIISGALLFSRIVSRCLQNYRQRTFAILIGIMVGTIRSVWPFWSYVFVLNPLTLEKGPLLKQVKSILPQITDPHFWIACLIALGSFLLVLSLERWNRSKQSNSAAKAMSR